MTKIFVARVMSQDDDFVVLQVGKRDDVSFKVEEGDEFLTLGFTVGDPWEEVNV